MKRFLARTLALGIAACTMFSVLQADVRAWRSKFGARVIEGEFVEVKGGQLTLLKKDGQAMSLPLSALSEEDQTFATERQATIDAKNNVDILAVLGGRMIQVTDGKPREFEIKTEKAPTHVLFYVVSTLCDTCQEHAPRLKSYYQETIQKAPQIELVVINLDSEKEDQEQYLAGHRLPFPAVGIDSMAEFEAAMPQRIFSRAIDGCQTFILTTANGKLISKSAIEPKRQIAEILKP